MIKLLTNIFKIKKNIETANVDIDFSLPVLSTEKIDEITRDALDKAIREKLKQEIIELCYTPDEIADTRRAIADHMISVGNDNSEYPNCITNHSTGGWSIPRLDFNVDRLVNKLIKESKNDL